MEDKARMAREIMGEGYTVEATEHGIMIGALGVRNGTAVLPDELAKLERVRRAAAGVEIRLVAAPEVQA